MDVLERVRDIHASDIHPGAAPVSEPQINGARQAVLRAIAHESASETRTNRRFQWFGGSALLGGAAAAALVVGLLANPAAPSPAAALVLEQAAETTLTTMVLDPGPGEFIRINYSFEQRFSGFSSADGVEHDVDYTVKTARSTYVPADRSADWVLAMDPTVVTVTGGDTGLTDEIAAFLGAGTETALAGVGPVESYPAGQIRAGDGWEDHDYRLNPMEQYYDEMPRDPRQLLNWIESYQSVPGEAPPTLIDLYGFNLAPPDLRATIFRAIAMAPDIQVIATDGAITTVSYPESADDSSRETISIDTDKGIIVGFGTESTDSEGTPRPSENAGRFSISIVDHAPEAVRITG